jgi:nicotinate dehydrogenase subunit A
MIMTVVALLEREPQPNEQQITDALSGNICRCGTHVEIMAAARQSVKLLAQTEPRS